MKTIEQFSDDLMSNFWEDVFNPEEAKAKRQKEYDRKFTATGIRTDYLLEEVNKIVEDYGMEAYWQRKPHANESAKRVAELIEKLEKERLNG